MIAPPAKRRFTRFSLRALLIVIVVCAAGFAWTRHHIVRLRTDWQAERQVLDQLETAGVRATGFTWVGPAWLRTLYGRDKLFLRVSDVQLSNSDVNIHDPAVIEDLKRLRHLEGVYYMNVVHTHGPEGWEMAERQKQNDLQHLAKLLTDYHVTGETYDP